MQSRAANFIKLELGIEMNDKFLTVKEVCNFLHVSKSTFYRVLAKEPSFPAPLKIGTHCVRYRMSEVITFCVQHTQVSEQHSEASK